MNENFSRSIELCINVNDSKNIDGVLFIGCNEEGEKTNPDKIPEWFSEDYIKLHKVFAIKEEEAFLLKIFTRNREMPNKLLRKKGGRKQMLFGCEVYGEVILACGRCGYRSSEGSNVRRHLKKAVCVRDRGYSREDLDRMNRIERQKFLRKIASAKFRAKKKLEDIDQDSSNDLDEESSNLATESSNGSSGLTISSDSSSLNPNSDPPDKENVTEKINDKSQRIIKRRLKKRKSSHAVKALALGPMLEKETVQRVSFDVYTINDSNVRIAWKPPLCHKSSGDACQIVFKGARMKRRCLDLPLPVILTYRKLDCKVHHCNFTLFHPHTRKACKDDLQTKTSVQVRSYGDTVMTQEFYHHFVSLLTIMKMKSSQCARHLTSVWETIITERLQTSTIPEEYRKLITLSKQTVKSIWANIEKESGRKCSDLTKSKRKRCSPAAVSVSAPSLESTHPLPVHQTEDLAYTGTSISASASLPIHPTVQEVEMQQSLQHHPHPLHSQVLDQQQAQQDYVHQNCMKRFSEAHKQPIHGSAHPINLPHSMVQAPSHPHWACPSVHAHPSQYHHNVAYSVHPQHDEYYSVQASFVSQYASSSIGMSP